MTDGAPELVLGPLLRYVAESEATIWAETDRSCQVAILGRQAQTFEVAGHHYALVVIGDLRPGTEYEYQVALDGTVRWPEPDSDFPPSVLRTTDPARQVRLVYGSCRIDEAGSEPSVRWLLSVVPTGMIFDDHDVHDDWNTSGAWRREYAAKPWWHERITSAYMSYWIYQHIGNLSPAELAQDELWQQVQEPGDHADVLRDLAVRADEPASDVQWSYRRTFGRVRVVVIDSRGGRQVEGETRLMTGEEQWRWITESVAGDWDHVVLASSLPLLLPAGIHEMEAWNEAVCGGAWGRRLAGLGERIRQELDLEHWAAFSASFVRFEDLLTELATGAHGPAPASVTVLGGDIHHSYLAQVEFRRGAPARGTDPRGPGPRSAVYQAVCSPIHNVLPDNYKRLHRLTTSKPGGVLGTGLARLARARLPRITWRTTQGPWFHNMLSSLEYEGRHARIRFARAVCDDAGVPHLQSICQTDLT
jgi:hypothetical protein